ncbi:MAG: hypothetical protein ACOX6C_01410 [Patescibacteria group bacterium]|jgi:hypothetical protein
MPKESPSAKKKNTAKTSKPVSKKTTASKKTATSKKTPAKKAIVKKSAAKKPVAKKPVETKASKVKPVFVDVIADQETEAIFDSPVYRPDYLEKNESEENFYNNQAGTLDFEPTDNTTFDKQKNFFSELIEESEDWDNAEETVPAPVIRKKPVKLYHRQAWGYIAATMVLLVAVFYIFSVKLTVRVYPQGAEIINDNIEFTVSSASELDSDKPLVRGEAKIVEQVAEKIYQVETDDEVDDLSGRVRGTVTLINKLNRNQRLVATTRLLAADGRLYRLDEAVNIPAGGELETTVYADELGRDKLLSSSEKLTIPGLWEGLQNSVYAESGEFFYQADKRTVITQKDLDKAAADLEAVLDEKAKNEFKPAAGQATAYKEVPDSFTVEFSAEAGDIGTEFTATGKKSYGLARFAKEDAINLAKNKLALIISDDRRLTAFNPESVVFTLGKYENNPAQATVTASFSGQMAATGQNIPVDPQKLTGLKEAQIKDHLDTIPELRKYELEFWPPFIKRAPYLPDRISVELAE